MKYIIATLALLTTIACGSTTKQEIMEEKTKESTTEPVSLEAPAPVFEIAVRMVKDSKKEAFVEARRNFITVLKAQSGVTNDREFQSFYALPQPDEREVFIGMTQYASPEVLQTVQGAIYEKFAPFAETMDLKAYVFVQLKEGENFDLATLAAQEGQVLEVAVRRVKEGQEEAFESSRTTFVNWLNRQDGVIDSWEFAVISGQDTERLTVGMSVYENQQKFQTLASQLQELPEAGAYFATFEPVALQYAFTTTNQ